MMHSSKVLTVSYGTFSCTLEGFDDPVETMKVVAEYFRELSNRDRYFGSEPPTPDPAVLNRLASQTIQRPVETEEHEDGVILRPAQVTEQVSARAAPSEVVNGNSGMPSATPHAEKAATSEAVEEATEEPPVLVFHSHRRPRRGAPVKAPDFPFARESDYREVETPETGSAEAAEAPREESEPCMQTGQEETGKEETGQETARTEAKAASEVPATTAGSEVEADGDVAHVSDEPFEAAQARNEVQAPSSETREALEEKSASDDAFADSAFEEGEQEAIPDRVAARIRRIREALEVQGMNNAGEAMEAEPLPETPEAETLEETASEAPAGTVEEETTVAASEPHAGHSEVPAEQTAQADRPKKAAEAASSGDGEAIERMAGEATRLGENILVLTREMSARAEEERVDRRASTSEPAEEAATEGEAKVPPITPRMEQRIRKRIAREELALARLLEATDKRMNQAEIARKRDEIRHLKAAILAAREDTSLSRAHRERAGEERIADFRRDLDSIEPVTRKQTQERPGSPSRPPLVLVEPIEAPGNAADESRAEASAGQEAGEMADWEAALLGAASFEDFIASIEITSVEGLIEAAAAWITYGEGRTRFSRIEVTEMIAPVCDEYDIAREEVLRAFGQLMREGALARLAPGDFALTKGTHFVRHMPRSA